MGSFMAGPYGSWVRVFLGFIVAAVLSVLQTGGSLSDLGTPSWWQVTLAGAVGAVVPIALAWLNPSDPRFGRTSTD